MASPKTKRIKYLHDQFELARKAAARLLSSSERADDLFTADKSITIEGLPDEQIVWLEAMASRFARLSDILTQKVFRAIDAIELTDEGTLLDRLSRMEKRGLLQEEEWQQIRELRNQVAHDYVVEDLSKLYTDIRAKCPVLLGLMPKLEEHFRQPPFAETDK